MEMHTSNKKITFESDNSSNVIEKEDTINLCISVFYNKLTWDVLVVDAILPFISQNKNLQFYFYLNELRGSNVRLVVEVQKENAIQIATSIDCYFKEFLAKKPSELIVNEENFRHFMNFKNNSIHYGLFEYISDSGHNFNNGLTDLLFFAFSEYRDEFHLSVNEIMFQIITIFFNAIKISDNEILKIFKELVETEHYQYDLNMPREIADLHEQFFLENKDILLPYLKEYRHINADDYEEKWEMEWHSFVKSFFNKKFESDSYEIKTALDKIMATFNFEDKINFYYLMINSIENYDSK